MRVALNAQLLSTASTYRAAGISRVIYELLARVRAVGGPFRYLAFAPDSPENRLFARSAGLDARLTRLPTDRPAVRVAWEQIVLPPQLTLARVDLLHALGFVSPAAWRGRTVVTAYDLSFLHFPEAFNRANRLYLSLLTPPSLRRADRVIAISEHTRQDVIRLCGVRPERVTTIHLAADERFRPAPPDAVARFRHRHRLDRPFILYLGTLQPRKNVAALVQAYAALRRDRRLPHALVLAGARGWRYESIFELVRRLGLEGNVLFPGFVSEDEKALWYTAADLFAYPSLYEGFGLQLLEAMACGTPVVASNSSSLPEVIGDAGVLVEPNDMAGLVRAIDDLLHDETRRARLRKAGLARAATFSWQRMAEQTVRVYREVLGA
jgi:glycosyltransferase involved in cell wall biosynthesis